MEDSGILLIFIHALKTLLPREGEKG